MSALDVAGLVQRLRYMNDENTDYFLAFKHERIDLVNEAAATLERLASERDEYRDGLRGALAEAKKQIDAINEALAAERAAHEQTKAMLATDRETIKAHCEEIFRLRDELSFAKRPFEDEHAEVNRRLTEVSTSLVMANARAETAEARAERLAESVGDAMHAYLSPGASSEGDVEALLQRLTAALSGATAQDEIKRLAQFVPDTTIGRLRQEIQAAQKDAERLEWLAARPREGSIRLTDDTFAMCNFWGISAAGNDLRAAIDAAIAKEPKT